MDYRIKEILTKIERRISRRLVVRELAESINISVSHFEHLFKKEMHTSPIKYINNLRLEKASELLVSSHLRVKQIRLKVGASNEAHFQRNFKRKFGETPNNYRKIFQNGEKNSNEKQKWIVNSRNG